MKKVILGRGSRGPLARADIRRDHGDPHVFIYRTNEVNPEDHVRGCIDGFGSEGIW
jgi:hypothetical protein